MSDTQAKATPKVPTVTKLEKELNRLAAAFHCSECDGQFTYGPGFPDFCPECGVEFDSTATVEEKPNGYQSKGHAE